MPREYNGGSQRVSSEAGEPLLSVAFLLAPEFTLMAFAGFVEALRHAADKDDNSEQNRCRWTILAPNSRPIRSSCGVEIAPWLGFVDPAEFDYVAVVGGLLRAHSSIGTEIPDFLRRAARSGVHLIGICTGSFILARAGLLDRRTACVSHYHIDAFRAEFPHLTAQADTLFATDAGVTTCAGGAAAIDLATNLINQHCGRAASLKCVSQMVMDHARRHNHPQAHLNASIASQTDPIIRRLALYASVNISRSMPITELASHLGVTVRQLERLCRAKLDCSPSEFIRSLRISHARDLLVTTDKRVTEIAFECGFADASHLARSCQETFGKTPSVLRATHQPESSTPTPRASARSAT